MRLTYRAANYELSLEVTGKFNVVVGHSGSGKSRLAEVANAFSGIPNNRARIPKPIYSSYGGDITPYISEAHDSVLVFDEYFHSNWLRRRMSEMQSSDNYYILITRDGTSEVPYGINNTFRVSHRNSNRLYMRPCYPNILRRTKDSCKVFIAEDSTLGYHHLNDILPGSIVVSAEGKSNLVDLVKSYRGKAKCLVMFDSCGIGADAAGLVKLQRDGDCILFDSASFEQEVLSYDFPGLYRNFTESDILAYHSEEEFYISQLSDVLNKLWGIGYHKNDIQLSRLLETGIANIHGKMCRMKDVGGVTGQTYHELRDTPSEQASEPIRNSKSISKMSLG